MKQLKIACLGDSMTDRGDEFITYRSFLGDDELPLLPQNIGSSGAPIGYHPERSSKDSFVLRWDRIEADSDIVLVFGGANDFGHSETPVTLGDENSDSLDVMNYCGAIRYLIENIRRKCPKALLVFATLLPRDNCRWYEHIGRPVSEAYVVNPYGYLADDYCRAMKTVCGKYGVPVIDLYHFAPLNGADKAVNQMYFLDGLHLNGAGAEILGKHFTACLKELLKQRNA